jgi:hypothetical protein
VIARAASHTRRMARRDEMSMSSDDAAGSYGDADPRRAFWSATSLCASWCVAQRNTRCGGGGTGVPALINGHAGGIPQPTNVDALTEAIVNRDCEHLY